MGRPPLLAVRCPIATGLASYLSGRFSSQVSGNVFIIANSRKLLTGFAQASSAPRFERSLCPAFQRLSFGGSRFSRKRQSTSTVLIHSSNLLPSGNCDSPKSETLSGYLTRLGTVSHRSSSLSPFFAFTSEARTSPEELVNSASVPEPCDPALEGLSQPA